MLFLHFLLEGPSGYGRPSSSVEYNQLPVASVTQSSTLTYQTSHPQCEQPNKNFMCFGESKLFVMFFIVCRAVTIWLSLVLVANKVTYYLPNPLKHLIWHIIMSEIIFTTYVNVFSCLIKVSLGGCILHHWNTISFLLLLPVCLIKDTIISEVTFIVSMKLIRHFKLQLNRIKIGT